MYLCSGYKKSSLQLLFLAVRAGFEPAIGYSPIHAFQACSFSHSDISPRCKERCLLYSKNQGMQDFFALMLAACVAAAAQGENRALWIEAEHMVRSICVATIPAEVALVACKLNVAKLSGKSSSERHLLSLLPVAT